MPLFPSQASVSNYCIFFEYLYKKILHFWKKRGMGGMPSLAPALQQINLGQHPGLLPPQQDVGVNGDQHK